MGAVGDMEAAAWLVSCYSWLSWGSCSDGSNLKRLPKIKEVHLMNENLAQLERGCFNKSSGYFVPPRGFEPRS